MMKGLFWNSNGLRDQAKFRFLFDSSKDQQLDFIAILETKRKDFLASELAHFCANKKYSWNWSPTKGRSGGILLGINSDNFDVQSVHLGSFHVKLLLRNKSDNFEWVLVDVYGAAQEADKNIFLQELVQTCNVGNIPIMVGGDFNIIRSPSEKNNSRYNDTCPFLFNAVINNLDLREIELTRRQYTWANNLQTPTYEKLDQILVSTYWEIRYPKVNVRALPRVLSDHTPLLLDTGMPSQHNAQMFKFELAWLLKDGFFDIVTGI
jgi:exonuclease III